MMKWNKYSTRKKPEEGRMILLQRKIGFAKFGSDVVYSLFWVSDRKSGELFTSEGNTWKTWRDWKDTAIQWCYLDELLKEGGLQ